MGHVRDRWSIPGDQGRKIRGPLWGHGKRWQARWSEEGREHSKGFDTKDAAVTFLAQVAAGVTPTLTHGTTLNAYADLWLSHQLHLRDSSRSILVSRLDCHVRPALGTKPLAAIKRRDVQNAVAQWSLTLSPRTVRSSYAVLSSILKAAVQDKMIAETPCVGIKLPEVRKTRVVPLTREQVDAITAAMSPHLRSMVTVAAATGMRLGELRGLTWDRVQRGRVTVDRQLAPEGGLRWTDPKTSAGHRTIDLGRVAQAALDEHRHTYGPGPGGLIWTTRDGRPLRHTAGVHAWAKMKARIPELGFRDRSGWHDLRHYNASLLIAAGLSVRAVADRLGHENPAITLDTYSHLWPTDQQQAADAIDAALG